MSDAELWAAWRLWIVVATVVVLLAAGLLITISLTARRILAEAVRALNAVEAIRKNTQPSGSSGQPISRRADPGDGGGHRAKGGALAARAADRKVGDVMTSESHCSKSGSSRWSSSSSSLASSRCC